jgi:hypothetical protein
MSVSLEFSILIAEDEEGNYEPIEIASSANEAREIAQSDMRRRLRAIESNEDPGICPYEYKVWKDGKVRLTISAKEVA